MFCPEILFKVSVYERYEITNDGSNLKIIYNEKIYLLYNIPIYIILFTYRHSGPGQALSEIKL